MEYAVLMREDPFLVIKFIVMGEKCVFRRI